MSPVARAGNRKMRRWSCVLKIYSTKDAEAPRLILVDTRLHSSGALILAEDPGPISGFRWVIQYPSGHEIELSANSIQPVVRVTGGFLLQLTAPPPTGLL